MNGKYFFSTLVHATFFSCCILMLNAESNQDANSDLTTVQENIKNNNGIDTEDRWLLEKFINKGQTVEQITVIAQNGLKNQDWGQRRNAFKLLEKLVEEGYAIEEAFTAAQDPDTTRFRALRLFKKLVEKGSAIEEATDLALEVRKSCNVVDLYAADLLLDELIKNAKVANQLTTVAQMDMMSNESKERSKSLRLFTKLVKNGHAFEEAIEAAVEGITSDDSWTYNLALQLFIALVEKNQAIEQAIVVAAQEEIASYNGFKLFESLIEKGYATEQATSIAQEGLKSHDQNVRNYAKRLLKKLSKQALKQKLINLQS